MATQWKWVTASRMGTSHQRRGEGCQDHASVREVPRGEGTALIAACADGAGSASRSALGARLACEALVGQAEGFVADGGNARDFTAEVASCWYGHARAALAKQADLDGVSLREYACTLLFAILDESGAGFAQLGDGAIVVRDGEGYKPVFWPQAGEYANMTWFLTGEDNAQHIMASAVEESPQDVALFTDGLQPLVLHYATRSAHAPFFLATFGAL